MELENGNSITPANGLADDFVTCLTWDKSRAQLWVGTRDGISTHHPLTDSWNSHSGELDNLGWVNDILLTEEFIWIATSEGLTYFDRSTETSPTLKHVGRLRGNWVNAISFSGDSFWARNENGIGEIERYIRSESYEIASPAGGSDVGKAVKQAGYAL